MALTKVSNSMQSSAPASVLDFGAVGNGIADDTAALQACLNSVAGSSGNGYQETSKIVDLAGRNIAFTGKIYVPINVCFTNGTLTALNSSSWMVWRNPAIAGGSVAYAAYIPYMTSKNTNVVFACIVVLNVYIGARFNNCTFAGVVIVNSNSLWTEFSSFSQCVLNGNSTVGAAIRFDGNNTGTSPFSTGTGAGTSDGSCGYTNFTSGCTISSSAPIVGILVTGGAALYNANIQFYGAVYGTSPSGGFIYLEAGSINYCTFDVHLEDGGTGCNVISMDDGCNFWYNSGNIATSSTTMVMAQGGSVDIRGNSIFVVGVVLLDANGNTVFNGTSYMTLLVGDLKKRNIVPTSQINGSWTVNNLTVSGAGNISGTAGTQGMTNGFFYIPAATGAPSGVPTAISGSVPMYYDSTNNQFYIYNGAWKKVALT